MNMLNPESENNIDEEFHQDQKVINANRVGLINALASFKPPDSTKTQVYKWYDTLKAHSKNLEDLHANYVTRLQVNYEESNQKIIAKMESTLEYLIQSRVVEENNSKQVLEQRLLPIWSKKQRQIEEYIETVEVS